MPDFAAFITKEQARIACAEILGWRIELVDGPNSLWRLMLGNTHKGIFTWKPQLHDGKPPTLVDVVNNLPDKLPYWTNSLDAMHEAWLEFSKVHQKAAFYCQLKSIVDRHMNDQNVGISDYVNATAPQRLEAFLRVHGRNVEIEK